MAMCCMAVACSELREPAQPGSDLGRAMLTVQPYKAVIELLR